jgi:flagellin
MNDSTGSQFSFQVGSATGPSNQISVTIDSMNTVGLLLNSGPDGIDPVTASNAVEAQDAYTALNINAFSNATDIGDVAGTNANYGNDQADVMASIESDTAVTITDGNGIETTVTLLDSNTDEENAALITGIAGITAVGAQTADSATAAHADGDGIALTFADVDATGFQAAVEEVIGVAANTNRISVEATTGQDNASENALLSIKVIDAAIKEVNAQRSELGAVSNRLNHTVNNLTNISSNLMSAKGGIEDTDFAVETTNLAKHQILQQASTAMLAQANASKQNVLALLRS